MAWAALRFSREARARLAGVLRALLIAQLIVSLCMVIYCYNTAMKVLLLLKNINRVSIYLLFLLIVCQAYCMKLHYTSGFRIVSWFLHGPYWSRTMLASRVWMIIGSCVATNGILVYIACQATLQSLMNELNTSLRVGISHYLVEPSWKKLLDTMQIELGCCGADEPSDWHEIPWINTDFLNENSEIVMKLAGVDGKVLPPVSPYSCCTPRVLAACYHDPLQQSEWLDAWADGSALLSASLHTRGCIEALRKPLTAALLALYLLALLVILFQVLITVLSQLLRTSAEDAVLRGDCDGFGDAVLFVRRPYVTARRETAEEAPLLADEDSAGGVGVVRNEPSVVLAVSRTRRRKRSRRRNHQYTYLS